MSKRYRYTYKITKRVTVLADSESEALDNIGEEFDDAELVREEPAPKEYKPA